MNPYKYKALDRNGVCHMGYTFSEDIKGLIHLLEKRHLFLVSYRKILHLEQWIHLRRARKEMESFFLHMRYMTRGGMGGCQGVQIGGVCGLEAYRARVGTVRRPRSGTAGEKAHHRQATAT